MGIIRKTISVSTAGLVDFRSDKERTARYSRQTRNAVRAQSQMQADLAAQQMTTPPPQPVRMTPGWYQHPGDPAGLARWWDGNGWTGSTQASAPPV